MPGGLRHPIDAFRANSCTCTDDGQPNGCLFAHGEADLNASFVAHGKVLAQKLPNVEAKFYPGEGHISLIHKSLKAA